MTKHDFKILSNMPYDDLISYWQNDKDELNNIDLYYWTPEKHLRAWKSIGLRNNHILQQKIISLFEPFGLTIKTTQYMITEPRFNLCQMHTDHGDARNTAINIPIEVETEKNFFLVGDKTELQLIDTFSASGATKYEYEPEKCTFFDCRKPWIFSTQQPHAFANYAETTRVVLSISIDDDYENAIKKIPKEWY